MLTQKDLLIIKEKEKGFSLVEILLATTIFVLIVSGLSSALIYGIQLSFKSGANSHASFLAQEGIEVLRSIKNTDFESIADGNYGIQYSDGSYSLIPNGDSDGNYNRTITVSTVDSDTKEIVCAVDWDQGLRGSGNIQLTSVFTNWRTISNDAGMLVYSDNSLIGDTIKYRLLYDDFTWGPESPIPDYGTPNNNSVRGIKLFSNPDRNEKILIVKNGESPGTQQDLFAMVWRGSGWGNIVHLAGYSSTREPWIENYDGTYLNDGTFMLLYDDNTSIPKYRVWNGSSWSTETNTVNTTNSIYWAKIEQKPDTNEVMTVLKDSAQRTLTMYFDGSSWSGLTIHGTYSPALLGENIDFKWASQDTNKGILAYNEEYDSRPNFRIWNGAGWEESIEPITVDGIITHTRLAQNPSTDNFLSCHKDEDRDINCLLVDIVGNVEEITEGEIAQWTHDNYEISFDVAFESSGNNALAVYANGTGVAQRRISKYRFYDPTTKTWNAEQDGITLGPTEASSMETVRLIPNLDNDYIMVIMSASDQDIWTNVWDGDNNSYFQTGELGPIEQGLYGSFDEDYWFDFAWR